MSTEKSQTWTFLTNHARVLTLVADEPAIRMRDVAARIGITERAAQRIVAELEEAGYLSHDKVGRRNQYHIRSDVGLRHPLEQDVEVGKLLELFQNRTAK